MNLRNGGQILIDSLVTHGASIAFGVPGESYLAALDAMHGRDDFRFIICRQEGGAAMMADAVGKLTGRPGICFVTRGPGATNASPGIHIAQHDSTPMILFIGQVARDQRDRGAFQEVDYKRHFADMAKWVAEIDDAARIPEYISRAFHTATSGRPGPVVLALPEDMLTDEVEAVDTPPFRAVEAAPPAEDIDRFTDMLAEAERPFVLVGGGGWDGNVCAELVRFAEAWNLPVSSGFRSQDRLDNNHPNYTGDVGIGPNPKLAQRVRDTDLLIALGSRMGEMTTSGYTLIEPPHPKQTLVHIFPDASEIGRVYHPALGIHSSMGPFLRAVNGRNARPGGWGEWTASARDDYEAWNGNLPTVPGDVSMAEVVGWLRDQLPRDTVICNGAGNFSMWMHRFYRYGHYRSQLAPTSGSMGYGTPAAVAAKILQPERTVIAIAGDGDFLMNGQELATAMQYGAAIIVILVNNGMYGTIRMHQEREFPGRPSGTELRNPDFAALARAYGAHGEVVEHTHEFPDAFARAQKSGKPALIELKVDPEAITAVATLSQIREQAIERKKAKG
ncbi:MAG: thiamine pyrophosphate-binding protein [Rhodospirillales bacterium]